MLRDTKSDGWGRVECHELNNLTGPVVTSDPFDGSGQRHDGIYLTCGVGSNVTSGKI